MMETHGCFGLERLANQECYSDLISPNSGRNTLLYMLKARSIVKLCMLPIFVIGYRDYAIRGFFS